MPATAAPRADTNTRVIRSVCGLVVLAGIAALLWRVHPPRQDPRDFQSLYAAAYCFAHHLRPYDTAQLDRILITRHIRTSGSWSDNLPLYPPTTLALFVPLTFLPIKIAAVLWYFLDVSCYIAAILWVLLAQPPMRTVSLPLRTTAAVVALLFPKATWSLDFGNPALLATSLLVFAVFYPDRNRNQPLRAGQLVLFSLALLLKPPLAGPYVLLFLIGSRRPDMRKLLGTLAGLAIFTASVLAYATHYSALATWRADIDRNLALARQSGMSMDPAQHIGGGSTMLHLQYLFGYWLSAYSTSLAVSAVAGGTLVAAFVVFAWRNRSQIRPGTGMYLLSAASLAPITLLLTYHRFYDAPLLVLALPWTLHHLRGRHSAAGWASAMLLAVLYKSWFRNLPLPNTSGILPALQGFLYSRYESLALLLLALVLLYVLAAANHTSRSQS